MSLKNHSEFIQAIRNCDELQILNILSEVSCSEECYKLVSKMSVSGQYPLHYTLQDMELTYSKRESESRIKIVKEILERIPFEKKLEYLKLRNTEGRTALHTAAICEESDVVVALLEELSMVDRSDLISAKDNQMLTVLQLKISQRTRRLILSYINCNAEIAAIKAKNSKLSKKKIFAIQKKKHSAGHFSGNVHVDHRVVKNSKNPSTHSSITPQSCLTSDTIFDHIDKLIDMITVSKNFDIIKDLENSNGQTLLHLAAKQNKVDIVRRLLSAIQTSDSHWMLISQKCKADKTALHYACIADSIGIVQLLLTYSQSHDITLTLYEDDTGCKAQRYAKSREIRKLLPLVKLHYWRVFYKPPTALIFYNRFLNYNRWRRDGAEEEKNHIKEALEQYGIETQVHVDFSVNTMLTNLRQVVEKENDISALIVIIMTHGELGYMYDVNLNQIRIQTVIDEMCYNSKIEFTPKVLMLQCCQHMEDSNMEDSNSRIVNCRHRRNPTDAATTSPLLTRRAPVAPETYKIPCGDTTIISSTLKGQKSERDRLGKAVSATACQPCKPSNLMGIFRSVSQKMGRTQPPELYTTMSRHLTLINLPAQRTVLEKMADFLLWSK